MQNCVIVRDGSRTMNTNSAHATSAGIEGVTNDTSKALRDTEMGTGASMPRPASSAADLRVCGSGDSSRCGPAAADTRVGPFCAGSCHAQRSAAPRSADSHDDFADFKVQRDSYYC